MTFIDSIRHQLQAMNAMERQQAISSLRDLIYEDTYIHAARPATDDEAACPRCGSLSVVRKGHDHDGVQRWLCKDCHRTFRNAVDTIITRSKLKPAVWMRYLECFVDCLPLRECASRCHISLRTSWLMRMRLIESIRRHLPRFHADGGHHSPAGQRHPMRQHRARLGARDTTVHGLLGHGIIRDVCTL